MASLLEELVSGEAELAAARFARTSHDDRDRRCDYSSSVGYVWTGDRGPGFPAWHAADHKVKLDEVAGRGACGIGRGTERRVDCF
jgi:hypothetical protein